MIRDHDTLNITNKTVLKKNAMLASNSYSGNKLQASHMFLDREDIAKANFDAVKELLTKMESFQKRAQIDSTVFSRCLLYKGVSVDDVLQFFSKYQFSEADKKFNYGLISHYIQKLADKGELTNWSVSIMSTNKVNENKRINLGVNSLEVFAVDRRESPTISFEKDQYGTVVKNITVLRDELIDLFDVEECRVNEIMTNGRLKESVIPTRNKRPIDRPLLLIYPIYTHHNLSENEINELKKGQKFEPIVTNYEHLFGITVVFPTTHQEKFEFNYLSNATINTKKAA